MTTNLLKITALSLLVSLAGCDKATETGNGEQNAEQSRTNENVPNLVKPKESEGPRLDKAMWDHYGNDVAAADPTATATEVAGDPKAYEGMPVLLRGKVHQVCASSGCWIELTDGENKVFVDTKHKIELPRDCAGTEVVVEGTGATRAKPRSKEREAVVVATGIALKKAE